MPPEDGPLGARNGTLRAGAPLGPLSPRNQKTRGLFSPEPSDGADLFVSAAAATSDRASVVEAHAPCRGDVAGGAVDEVRVCACAA